MFRRRRHVSVIVVGAAASGAATFAEALSRHTQLHPLDDDAVPALGERLRVLVAPGEKTGSLAPAIDAAVERQPAGGAQAFGAVFDALAEILPDALVVHVVRDGRAVALARANSSQEP